MPASYCGIVGLKATYGLVPIRGITPLTLSLDHCGPMTRTVRDTALMLGVMAGYDKYDITSAEHGTEDYMAALGQGVSGLKLGLPAGYFDDLDPEVAAAFDAASAVLARLSAGLVDGTLPSVTHLGNLGRLGETFAWHEPYYRNAADKYMLAERRRLELAAESAPRAVDYIRAKWEVEGIRRRIDDAFKEFDLVVLPTQRILPPKLDELINRAQEGKAINPRVTSNCQPFDVFGIPAVSIPCGFSRSGLPIGLMIAGPRFSEGRVLALAQAYEAATDWHLRRPPLAPDTPKPAIAKYA
jgi:aspartyl-tRNA(Asn)/glutamyl-tRNA(Gln) amidotransferase subunit A